MCGVVVVDACRSWSTWLGRDANIHNHCLGYHHNFALFYQLLDSNLFTHRMFSFKREASSETYGPGSIFHHISFRSTISHSFTFRSINQKPKRYLLYLLFSFIYLYQISSLQVTVKGLATPLSHWVQVFDCLCRSIDWGLASTSYWIDTLVLKSWGKYLLYFAASPFPLQGRNQGKLKR